jgi:hypothetical protein
VCVCLWQPWGPLGFYLYLPELVCPVFKIFPIERNLVGVGDVVGTAAASVGCGQGSLTEGEGAVRLTSLYQLV